MGISQRLEVKEIKEYMNKTVKTHKKNVFMFFNCFI